MHLPVPLAWCQVCPMQASAAAALYHLASGSQESRDAVTASGALAVLVRLLGSDQPAVQFTAAGVLGHLAYGSQIFRMLPLQQALRLRSFSF